MVGEVERVEVVEIELRLQQYTLLAKQLND